MSEHCAKKQSLSDQKLTQAFIMRFYVSIQYFSSVTAYFLIAIISKLSQVSIIENWLISSCLIG